MRHDQLFGRELARIGAFMLSGRAKEGHLKAELFTVSGLQPAGGVPPLSPKIRVRAEVARKAERGSWINLGKARRFGLDLRRDQEDR